MKPPATWSLYEVFLFLFSPFVSCIFTDSIACVFGFLSPSFLHSMYYPFSFSSISSIVNYDTPGSLADWATPFTGHMRGVSFSTEVLWLQFLIIIIHRRLFYLHGKGRFIWFAMEGF